jgi:secreted trypsin-like serine protease
MSQRDNGQWVLLGTVSHGIKCAEPNLPGVYMRTSAYRKWIDNVIHNSQFRPPSRTNLTSGSSSAVDKLISLSVALSASTARPERMAHPVRQPKFSFWTKGKANP